MEDDSWDLGNCSDCEGHHTVVRLEEDSYLCTCCFLNLIHSKNVVGVANPILEIWKIVHGLVAVNVTEEMLVKR